MGNYAVNADVSGFKIDGSTVDLTQYTSAEITAEILFAETMIEEICEDIFYSKTETNTFDGTGNVKLFFMPKIKYRLLTVTALKELDLDGSTVLDTYTENTDYKKYPFYVETARTYSGDSPRRRFGTGGIWPKGQNNIQVIGAWGRASVPAEIKRATILLTLERLKPGSTNQTPADVMQSGWGDFQITFKSGSGLVSGQETGLVEVDRMLRRYYNDIDLFLAVPTERTPHDEEN
tara:strand:- start:1415 stop:2116 length:702 start_codon:yes stop_codon:yes gene_type:complete